MRRFPEGELVFIVGPETEKLPLETILKVQKRRRQFMYKPDDPRHTQFMASFSDEERSILADTTQLIKCGYSYWDMRAATRHEGDYYLLTVPAQNLNHDEDCHQVVKGGVLDEHLFIEKTMDKLRPALLALNEAGRADNKKIIISIGQLGGLIDDANVDGEPKVDPQIMRLTSKAIHELVYELELPNIGGILEENYFSQELCGYQGNKKTVNGIQFFRLDEGRHEFSAMPVLSDAMGLLGLPLYERKVYDMAKITEGDQYSYMGGRARDCGIGEQCSKRPYDRAAMSYAKLRERCLPKGQLNEYTNIRKLDLTTDRIYLHGQPNRQTIAGVAALAWLENLQQPRPLKERWWQRCVGFFCPRSKEIAQENQEIVSPRTSSLVEPTAMPVFPPTELQLQGPSERPMSQLQGAKDSSALPSVETTRGPSTSSPIL